MGARSRSSAGRYRFRRADRLGGERELDDHPRPPTRRDPHTCPRVPDRTTTICTPSRPITPWAVPGADSARRSTSSLTATAARWSSSSVPARPVKPRCSGAGCHAYASIASVARPSGSAAIGLTPHVPPASYVNAASSRSSRSLVTNRASKTTWLTRGRQPAFDRADYRGRVVERGFCEVKQWCGLATRHEKLALTYRGGVACRTRPSPGYARYETRPSLLHRGATSANASSAAAARVDPRRTRDARL